jgi:hypothetical protein
MTAPHADQLIDGYLARLQAASANLPKSARHELVEDMRSHIAEARNREPGETDATILNILDRLGDPAAVVAEARERLGIRAPQPYRPGLLEIAAVILVPFFWPVGVILLWMSPAWRWPDKLIGSLVPPGGYLAVFFVGAAVATIHSGTGSTCVSVAQATAQAIQSSCQGSPPSPLETAGSVLLALLFYALPLITAGYLGVRLRWGRPAQVAVA